MPKLFGFFSFVILTTILCLPSDNALLNTTTQGKYRFLENLVNVSNFFNRAPSIEYSKIPASSPANIYASIVLPTNSNSNSASGVRVSRISRFLNRSRRYAFDFCFVYIDIPAIFEWIFIEFVWQKLCKCSI